MNTDNAKLLNMQLTPIDFEIDNLCYRYHGPTTKDMKELYTISKSRKNGCYNEPKFMCVNCTGKCGNLKCFIADFMKEKGLKKIIVETDDKLNSNLRTKYYNEIPQLISDEKLDDTKYVYIICNYNWCFTSYISFFGKSKINYDK